MHVKSSYDLIVHLNDIWSVAFKGTFRKQDGLSWVIDITCSFILTVFISNGLHHLMIIQYTDYSVFYVHAVTSV